MTENKALYTCNVEVLIKVTMHCINSEGVFTRNEIQTVTEIITLF